MPYHYRIDEDHPILWIEIADPTSYEEIFEGVRQLVSDPALYPGLRVLSDHRELDYLASPELIKSLPTLFDILGEKIGPHRTAVVAGSETSFGMIRMAEMLAEGGPAEIRAFWTLEEAQAWLLS